jgi:hypothetical protein
MIMTDESKPVEEQVENQALIEDAEPKEVKAEREEGAPIPRHLVTEIVKRERLSAIQKAKREFMQELEAQRAAEAAQAQAAPVAQQSGNVGLGGMPMMTPEQIQQMIAAEAKKLDDQRRLEAEQQQHYQSAQQVAQNFNSQMAQGKAKHPDFDDKVKDLDFAGMAPIVHLAAETGIADDIMLDLVDNPQKITHLMMLAHTQPKLAQREMAKLAASIKANQQAVQQASPRDPLNQITPSTVGTGNGDMSVADYMKIFI